MPVWRTFLQRCPVAKRDQSPRNAFSPNSHIYLREPRKQVFENGLRGTIEFGKVEARRASRRSTVDGHWVIVANPRTTATRLRYSIHYCGERNISGQSGKWFLQVWAAVHIDAVATQTCIIAFVLYRNSP